MMSHKKIHRFLVEHIPPVAIGTTVTITDEQATKQINRVLKIRPGEDIQVFVDEGPQYTMTLTASTDFSITGTVTAVTTVPAPSRTIIAAISIVKGDAFELIVQKLTELGISTIVPLITSRTVKQSIRSNRLQAISDEAVEQCGATQRVHILEPMTLEECFKQFPYFSIVLDPITTEHALPELPDTLVYYVGPEGGWDEHDEEVITAHTPHHLSVSNRVLRTETAAIVGAYQLLQ